MKRIIVLISCFLLATMCTAAQDVACDDLLKYVEKNGRLKGSVSQFQLIESSWLKEVKAYSIDNTIVVIAEIKRDDYGFNTKKYVFCGIPSSNWDSFYFGLTDLGKTFGERFQKYIFDYKCDCY